VLVCIACPGCVLGWDMTVLPAVDMFVFDCTEVKQVSMTIDEFVVDNKSDVSCCLWTTHKYHLALNVIVYIG